jgi:hypothetical protein
VSRAATRSDICNLQSASLAVGLLRLADRIITEYHAVGCSSHEALVDAFIILCYVVKVDELNEIPHRYRNSGISDKCWRPRRGSAVQFCLRCSILKSSLVQKWRTDRLRNSGQNRAEELDNA